MNFNFELILFYVIIATGLISLLDSLFLAKKRKAAYENKIKDMPNPPELKLPFIIDYSRAFFPILLIVFLLRSFLYEPFRIPSGSLEPTLLIGDFILVNKFDYGIRLPVIHTKIIKRNEPKRGDIIVFRWPPNPSIDFIKRVVGVPGDYLTYVNKVLYVNGQKATLSSPKNIAARDDDGGEKINVIEKQENLFGVKHAIYQNPLEKAHDIRGVTIPLGMYFVMGDNRDNSADSRFWGFVPEENIVGKAIFVWMSWDSLTHHIRFNRLAERIN